MKMAWCRPSTTSLLNPKFRQWRIWATSSPPSGMMNNVGCCIPGVSEKVRAVVACDGIAPEHIGKAMERGRGEAFLVDVGKRSHGPAVSHAQEVEIIRMFAILSQHGNGVQA